MNLLDYARPFGDVGLDALLELVRAARRRLVAEGVQLLDRGRLQENARDLAVEPVDDRCRKARGPDQALPAGDVEAGDAGFRQGRRVGQSEIALGARDRERA